MNETIKLMAVAEAKSRSWFEQSLGGGFDLSSAVLSAKPFDGGRFLAFVPSEIAEEDIRFPDAPDVPTMAAQAGLARYLDEWTSNGASCLLVEDDVVERGDPALEDWSIPSAFVGDRVVHWFDLESESGTAAVEGLNWSAFGYPLNAFVVSSSARDLGLIDGESVPVDFLNHVVSSLLGVVVAAFDATSFALWNPS